MKKNSFSFAFKLVFVVFTLLMYENVIAQYQQPAQQSPAQGLPVRNTFWDKVQFGGGLGLNFSSGYTEISVSPSAIYNVNPYLATGIGLSASYISSGYYDSGVYGASLLTFINPIPQIQFSINLNESYVNNHYDEYLGQREFTDNFWNTALFLGVGYRAGNITVGIAYNVLFDEDDHVYTEAYMPFVRAYF